VGLVLGGGGARGGAHLGVLEVLEELRVPIACIAGTSMGALVGGAYAAGVAPEEIIDLVGRTDWNAMFDDSAGRESVDIRRKELDDRFYSGLEFGVSREGVKFREGVVAGEKLKLFFNRLVRADLGDRPIEELRMPLAVIATDIGTGERVAIRSGNLTSAMRASMSVPGLIAPVLREGRKLVDGGLTGQPADRGGARALQRRRRDRRERGLAALPPRRGEGRGHGAGPGGEPAHRAERRALDGRAAPRGHLHPPRAGRHHRDGVHAPARGARARPPRRAGVPRGARGASRYRAPRTPTGRTTCASPPSTRPPIIDQVTIEPTRFVNRDTIRRGIGQKEASRSTRPRSPPTSCASSTTATCTRSTTTSCASATARSCASRRSRNPGDRTTCASA
jgi:hypothetical protein